ncbi:MAG: GPR endopeptidase [Oscillospiraceae bacterium]|nr:GPR endopeptidase [Oscillospiraceae bacterium]
MNFRTDLALERSETFGGKLPEGVKCEITEKDGAKTTVIEVTDERGEQAIGKPIGKYITVEVPPFSQSAPLFDDRIDAVTDGLKALLPKDGPVLVAGLGNDDITPDALGPKCSSLILATRHIDGELAKSAGLGELRPVACLTPGVLGKTGIETGEIIAGAVKTVKPSVVITVDALAARRLSRLGCTVQMSDTGVTPGSGVGNSRMEISSASLGVPVVAIGVPTVVDAATLASDLGYREGEGGEGHGSALEPEGARMMITPREIDLVIERAARMIAMAINSALQPHIPMEDIIMLVS